MRRRASRSAAVHSTHVCPPAAAALRATAARAAPPRDREPAGAPTVPARASTARQVAPSRPSHAACGSDRAASAALGPCARNNDRASRGGSASVANSPAAARVPRSASHAALIASALDAETPFTRLNALTAPPPSSTVSVSTPSASTMRVAMAGPTPGRRAPARRAAAAAAERGGRHLNPCRRQLAPKPRVLPPLPVKRAGHALAHAREGANDGDQGAWGRRVARKGGGRREEAAPPARAGRGSRSQGRCR